MRSQIRTILLVTLGVLILSAPPSQSVAGKETATCQVASARADSQSAAGSGPLFALIGDDARQLGSQASAGIGARVVSLSWREYHPREGVVDRDYVEAKRQEFRRLRAAGFKLILSLGYHDTPTWLHSTYGPASYYVNQRGIRYTGTDPLDNGDANLVFNPRMRSLVATYIRRVFRDFGGHFAAVRVGGGRYGELTYPPAEYAGGSNNYWAYDPHAARTRPGGPWRPGIATSGQAPRQFLEWYLDRLASYQTWQIRTVRRSYPGPLMVLYPSWGIRPGQIDEAVAGDLSGATSAELNGEIQRGYDFARQVAAISDDKVVVTTTWLDADAQLSAHDRSDPRYWSPVRFLASLAAAHPLTPRLYGENTGDGGRVEMRLAGRRMARYNLVGFAWYRERELLSGKGATLRDYQATIRRYRDLCSPRLDSDPGRRGAAPSRRASGSR